MIPRQFLNTFGQATPTFLRSEGGDTFRIPEDADRYLLCFWSSSGDWTIRPTGELDYIDFGFFFQANSRPVTITHALHGAMVNMAWQLVPLISSINLIYIQAYMRQPEVPISAVPAGTELPIYTPRSVTQQYPPSLVVPPEVEMPPIPPLVPPTPTGRYRFFIRSAQLPLSDTEVRMFLAQGYRVEYEPGVGAWAVPL